MYLGKDTIRKQRLDKALAQTINYNMRLQGIGKLTGRDSSAEEKLLQARLKPYGLSTDEYNALFASQKGCCAVCGAHQGVLNHTLYIDHDHNTGKVRGLLCSRCNQAVGYAESPDLDKILAYIEKFKTS